MRCNDFNWRNEPRDVLNIPEKCRCQRGPVNCPTVTICARPFKVGTRRCCAFPRIVHDGRGALPHSDARLPVIYSRVLGRVNARRLTDDYIFGSRGNTRFASSTISAAARRRQSMGMHYGSIVRIGGIKGRWG